MEIYFFTVILHIVIHGIILKKEGSPYILSLVMGLKINFDELLTFLSLRNYAELIKVIFEGELGRGKLIFANSSINALEYGGRTGDEALDILLKEKDVNLIELEDIVIKNEEELLFRIINKSLSNIEDFVGLIFLDSRGNILLQRYTEKKSLEKEFINALGNLIASTETSSVFIEEKGLYIFWARIKDGLNAVVLTESPQSHRTLKSLFTGIVKITKK